MRPAQGILMLSWVQASAACTALELIAIVNALWNITRFRAYNFLIYIFYYFFVLYVNIGFYYFDCLYVQTVIELLTETPDSFYNNPHEHFRLKSGWKGNVEQQKKADAQRVGLCMYICIYSA